MQCPECLIEKKNGIVDYAEKGIYTHLMHIDKFIDENNKKHIHDGNIKGIHLKCENGHDFWVSWYRKCWCGWQR